MVVAEFKFFNNQHLKSSAQQKIFHQYTAGSGDVLECKANCQVCLFSILV